jgi:3-oxoacyl-[acyl-carrier-protein] synthase II
MTDDIRVVITGIGFRSPIGHTMKELKTSLLEGKSGIKYIPEWEKVGHMRTRLSGVCEGIDEKIIPRPLRRSMGRLSILAALSVMDAVKDSGLNDDFIGSGKCGVSYGSTEGSSQAMEEFTNDFSKNGSLLGLESSTYLKFMSHTCAANISMMFHTKGPLVASCTACVSGSQGIGFGYEAIKSGKATVMLSGGAEEMHFYNAAIFELLRATSIKYNDCPDKTPRPFDAERDGLVVGEGAGCLVLEDYEHAKERGAQIYAEIIGYATNCDGTHLTNPSADGMAGVMLLALKDAGISPDKIGHVNAHATATEVGDIAEAAAISKVFGDKVPVSAFKGYMGHTLGACGALESIITICMMNEGFMAHTKNLETPDPVFPKLNHIMKEPVDKPFAIGMNNNFAFGGINTSLIFKKI